MPRIDLVGKPIVITGASSGIGAATAVACAKAGMPVVLGARRADKVEAVAAGIRESGGKAFAQVCDVTKPGDCVALLDACEREFGPVYAAYANAGYGIEKPIHETTDAEMRGIFETNFFGTMNMVQPAAERMLRQGRGHILICSSCLSKATVPYYGAYSATKAAQAHIGRSMRLELEPRGVHVSVVCPIGTRTEFFETVKQKCEQQSLVKHTPEFFKQDALFVAELTVRCLRRPRAEVWTGFKGAFVRLGVSVMTAWPWVADASTRGMVSQRAR